MAALRSSFPAPRRLQRMRDELEDVVVTSHPLVRGNFALRAGDRLAILTQHALQRVRLAPLVAHEKDGREAALYHNV